MIDKGLTTKALYALRKLGHEVFHPAEIGNSGFMSRLQKYGLIEKVGYGQYKVKDEVNDIFKAYREKVKSVMNGPRGPRGKRLALNKDMPNGNDEPTVATIKRFKRQQEDQVARALPFGEEGHFAIQIGRRYFYGVELDLPVIRRFRG